jgi:dimethylamine monooxygenase subunit A
MRYLPFDGGRFRLMMGLMPLAWAEWIEIDGNFVPDLAAKDLLLSQRHGEVFAALPAAEAPAAELLTLLTAHLPEYHPKIFRREGAQLCNTLTGTQWPVEQHALHPLDLAGRLVQEDFCLLAAEGGAYRLVGASLCSPSRWRLADKLGAPLALIHAPVPGYAEGLAEPVDRFFAQLKPGRLVWRLNWTIADHPTPFQPVRLAPPLPITAETAGDRLYLRVERQTLQRLPATRAVVFTIRTYIASLAAAISGNKSAADLAGALRAMPEATQRYKHIAPHAEALLAWLSARMP